MFLNHPFINDVRIETALLTTALPITTVLSTTVLRIDIVLSATVLCVSFVVGCLSAADIPSTLGEQGPIPNNGPYPLVSCPDYFSQAGAKNAVWKRDYISA